MADEKKDVKQAELKGTVKMNKPSLGQKMHDAFISQDFKSAASGVVQDTFVPMTKRLAADFISNLINRMLFGSKAQSNQNIFGTTWRYTGWGTGGINYSGISTQNATTQTTQQTLPGALNYNDITFSNRQDAEEALLTLTEMLERYSSVSVADYYEYLKFPTVSTQYNYGWKSLAGADVEEFRGEFHLRLPKPIPLR